MGTNYYPQSNRNPQTMTVGKLISLLIDHDPDAPVVFKLPKYGAFGGECTYSIDRVRRVELEPYSRDWPECSGEDEDGEPFHFEAYTEHFPAWAGVEIG